MNGNYIYVLFNFFLYFYPHAPIGARGHTYVLIPGSGGWVGRLNNKSNTSDKNMVIKKSLLYWLLQLLWLFLVLLLFPWHYYLWCYKFFFYYYYCCVYFYIVYSIISTAFSSPTINSTIGQAYLTVPQNAMSSSY